MQPTTKSLPSAGGQLVNSWSIDWPIPRGSGGGQWAPLRGPLTAYRPHHAHWPRSLPTKIARSLPAVVGYAVLALAEGITRPKRHKLTAAKPRTVSVGGANVLP
ncbi:hypothetical protein ACVMB1_006124 [Bradyrhizobium sp. USDA 4504]